MKKILIVLLIAFLAQTALFAAASQAASSADRGSYLAGLGRVIPPEDIHIDSYINQSDYNYPYPSTGALGIITAAGYSDNTAYLLVGLRGRRVDFSALPPMNISFVIDISGSMSGQDKLDWVKESLHIFIDRVRPEDFVSLVVFDNRVELLMEPGHIRNQADKDRFRGIVDSLRPRGSTNIYGGMEMGFDQVAANYRPDYANRVILLTDGMDNASGKTNKDFLDLAALYMERGINISTISLGAEADINLMVDVAIAGGGSSRFISDRIVMEQTFGSELDRLVVAAAKNLEMEIVLADGITVNETWGYSYWIGDNTVHYSLGTLHNGDYETIVIEAVPERPLVPGSVMGNFFISYEDTSGRAQREGPFPIVLGQEPGGLINDERVREAEGYIALSRGLLEIGSRAPELSQLQQYSRNSTEMASFRRMQVVHELDFFLDIVENLTTHLNRINESLGGGRYEPELRILENYRNSFTRSRDEYSD